MTRAEIPDGMENELAGVCLTTHSGHPITPKEDRFVQYYIELGEPGPAAEKAGYAVREHIKNKNLQWRKKGEKLLTLDYINEEIAYRAQKFRDEHIATPDEIMQYLTAVMRGEVKDQFGLDAPLGERTNAAKELAKRVIDMAQNQTAERPEIKVVIERRK